MAAAGGHNIPAMSSVFTGMRQALGAIGMTDEQERRFSEDMAREGPRLRSFVRRRVADAADVEDILQEVFFELAESYRAVAPVGPRPNADDPVPAISKTPGPSPKASSSATAKSVFTTTSSATL